MADRKVRTYTPAVTEPELPGWAKEFDRGRKGPAFTPAPPPSPENEAAPYVPPLSPSARYLGDPLPCGHVNNSQAENCGCLQPGPGGSRDEGPEYVTDAAGVVHKRSPSRGYH